MDEKKNRIKNERMNRIIVWMKKEKNPERATQIKRIKKKKKKIRKI